VFVLDKHYNIKNLPLSIRSAIALLHFGHWSKRTLQVSHTILCPHGLNVALATSSLHEIHGTTSRAARSCMNGSPVTVACAFSFLHNSVYLCY